MTVPLPQNELRAALKELRINANRLCDRSQGGTYEEDCRRSIARADAALASQPLSGDADLLRQLIEKWRERYSDELAFWHTVHPRDVLRQCVSELEAALSTLQVSSNRSEPIEAKDPNRSEPMRRGLARLLDNLYGLHLRSGHLDAIMDVIQLHEPVKVPVSSGSAQEWQPEVERLKSAIRWALGCEPEDEFAPRPEGGPPYWWRKGLRRRAGNIEPAPPASSARSPREETEK